MDLTFTIEETYVIGYNGENQVYFMNERYDSLDKAVEAISIKRKTHRGFDFFVITEKDLSIINKNVQKEISKRNRYQNERL